MADRGHTTRPHTADVIIRAWGPSAEACYEEAVAAFVAVFADVAGAGAGEVRRADVGPGGHADRLVLLLEEVLAAVEVDNLVPVAAHVELRGDGLAVTFTVVPLEAVELNGAVPKGVSYSGLRFEEAGGAWRCEATVDV